MPVLNWEVRVSCTNETTPLSPDAKKSLIKHTGEGGLCEEETQWCRSAFYA